MNNPTIYYADINDHDETGSDEPAFCHVVLASEYNQLRAELAALKAGQGVAITEVSAETFSSDGTSDIITCNLPIGTKLYLSAPPAPADARLVPLTREAIHLAFEHKLRAVNQPHYGERRGDWRTLNREELADVVLELLAAPPASADAVSVPRELLERLCGATQQSVVPDLATLRTLYVQRMKATDELRALLAQSESKG